MKMHVIVFYSILCGLVLAGMSSILTSKAEAQQQCDCTVPAQMAAYCAGLYPPSVDMTDQQIDKNADKLNVCVDNQEKKYKQLIFTYQFYFSRMPELDRMFTECSKLAYDPHYLNMEKFHTCVIEIINKANTM